jgi:hypothetical protein
LKNRVSISKQLAGGRNPPLDQGLLHPPYIRRE